MNKFAGAMIAVFIATAAFSAKAQAPNNISSESTLQFDMGKDAYDSGDYQQAVVAFERAYTLNPDYKILYYIAIAEQKLGNETMALHYYTRCLTDMPADGSTVMRLKMESEVAKLKQLVGMVEIRSEFDQAVVMIDGEPKGRTPLAEPITVDSGSHRILVKRGVETLFQTNVRVEGGQTLVVEAKQMETGPQEGAPALQQRKIRRFTWLAVGVGALSGIAATAISAAAWEKDDQLEKDIIENDCVDTTCPSSMEDQDGKVKRLNIAADVMWGMTGVGLLTGLVLYFVEPKIYKEKNVDVNVTPVADGSSAGLMFETTF